MSTIFKALSDPTRRRVLELLKEKPLSAGEISDHFEFSKPTMSAHLSVLREADLVASEKHGKSVVYQLKISVLEDALLAFAEMFGWELKDIESSTAKRSTKPRSNLEVSKK